MRRREFLLSLTAATILSGCGSVPPTQPAPIPPPPPPDPAATASSAAVYPCSGSRDSWLSGTA